jgi:hypothetical protein
MDRVRTSVIGSLILVSALGTQYRSTPSPKSPVPETQSIETPSPTDSASSDPVNASSRLPHNEDGPWSALCHYFAVHDPEDLEDSTQGEQPKSSSASRSKSTSSNQYAEPGIRNGKELAVPGTLKGKQLAESRKRTIEKSGGNGDKLKETAKRDVTQKWDVTQRVIGNPRGCLPNGLDGTYRLGFLIATVPDPFHSSMTMEYDRTLESIERAAAFAGYTIDRYWLPWDEIYLQPQTDLVKTRTLSRDQHLREDQPGLLLFHCVDQLAKPRCTPGEKKPTDKKDLHTHLLLVFLAGETPSSGINKVAFAKAVRYIQELRRNEVGMETDDFKPDELRLAGPRFSGSLHALKVALLELGNAALGSEEPPHDLPETIRIVSGASNRSAIQEFCELRTEDTVALNDLIPCKIALQFPYLPEIPVTFQQITYDQDISRTTILTALQKDLNYARKEVALLSESASKFGAGTDKNLGADTDKNRGAGNTENPGSEYLEISYPRGIAPVRNAYQAAQEAMSTESSSRKKKTWASLPLTVKEVEAREQERWATLSKEQTPLSQDAVLGEIARSLRQHQIRAVVITATDSIDALFLIRYLRQACPDIQVVLPNPDLLFARTENAADFTGIITFSTYPLFSNSRYLRLGTNKVDKFPSSATEGVFMAVLSQLQSESDPILYSRPEDPNGHPLPSIWMGVAGKAGLWPVHEYPLEAQSKRLSSVAIPTHTVYDAYRPEAPPRHWRLVWSLILSFGVLHCIAVCLSLFNPKNPALRDKWWKKYVNRWWQEYFNIEDDSKGGSNHGHVQARSFYLLVATLQVCIMQLVMLLPAWRLRVTMGWKLYVVLAAAAPIFLWAFGVALIILFRLLRVASGKRLALIVLATFVPFLYVAGCWGYLCFRTCGAALSFSERSVYLTSGVSPALPMLLIASGFYLWGMANMRRLTFCQNRRPDLLGEEEFNGVFHGGFEKLREDFDTVLCGFVPTRVGFRDLTIVAVVMAFLFEPWKVRSLEGWFYNVLLCSGLVLLWGAISVAWFRFMYVWWLLRKLLVRLERLPLRNAFNRIPSIFSWSPIWQRSGTKRTYLVLTYSLEYLRCLARTDQYRVKLLNQTEPVEQKLSAVLEKERSGNRIPGNLSDALNKEFEEVTKRFALYLSDWKPDTTDATKEDYLKRREVLPLGEELSTRQSTMVAAEFIALRFVAYIRYVTLQMRNTLTFISIGFILSLLALKSYPFQPRQTIVWSLIGLFVVLSAGIIYVFAEMDKDAILSRISGTDKGKLDKEFFWRLVSFGALPLLTIIATQIPAVSDFLLSWLQPSLESLR